MKREDFLARRMSGIGGSDVAAVLGISPWRTQLDVYLSKVEPPSADAGETNEPMYWGTVLEDVVAREYATRTGAKVQRVNALLRHPRHEWLIANLDRAVVTPGSRARLDAAGVLVGADGALEAKTSNAYSASDWGRDGDDDAIPVHYAAQGMSYLAVTGLPWIDFAVLIGGQRFLTKRLHRDEETIAAIIERCEAFWFDHVVPRRPPPAVNAADVLKLFPSDNGETVEADESLLIAFNEAAALREQLAAVERDLEDREQRIKIALGAASALVTQGKPLVTWKRSKDSMTFCANAFRAAHPDLAAQFTVARPGSRRFVFCKQ